MTTKEKREVELKLAQLDLKVRRLKLELWKAFIARVESLRMPKNKVERDGWLIVIGLLVVSLTVLVGLMIGR